MDVVDGDRERAAPGLQMLVSPRLPTGSTYSTSFQIVRRFLLARPSTASCATVQRRIRIADQAACVVVVLVLPVHQREAHDVPIEGDRTIEVGTVKPNRHRTSSRRAAAITLTPPSGGGPSRTGGRSWSRLMGMPGWRRTVPTSVTVSFTGMSTQQSNACSWRVGQQSRGRHQFVGRDLRMPEHVNRLRHRAGDQLLLEVPTARHHDWRLGGCWWRTEDHPANRSVRAPLRGSATCCLRRRRWRCSHRRPQTVGSDVRAPTRPVAPIRDR